MKIFKVFKQLYRFAPLFPMIIFLMTQAELAWPGEVEADGTDTRTNGEKKLATVKAGLEEFWSGAEDSFGDFTQGWPFIERIIARFSGMFGKKKAE